jgi:G3E family GTPase
MLHAHGDDAAALDGLLESAQRLFDEPPQSVAPGGRLSPGIRCRLQLDPHAAFSLDIPAAGTWALFTEHAPAEFGMHLHGPAPAFERSFGSHHHDLAISSIGLTDARALDPDKVNQWLSYLLQSRGQDILRMKGVLNFKGEPRRYVFHGVHMVFDGQLERPWNADAPRLNKLVFIGRNLDRNELEAGFESCIA